MNYAQLRQFVILLSVLNVPLGVFIGWMMALGNILFVLGIVVLMAFDYYGSKMWLRAIELASLNSRNASNSTDV